MSKIWTPNINFYVHFREHLQRIGWYMLAFLEIFGIASCASTSNPQRCQLNTNSELIDFSKYLKYRLAAVLIPHKASNSVRERVCAFVCVRHLCVSQLPIHLFAQFYHTQYITTSTSAGTASQVCVRVLSHSVIFQTRTAVCCAVGRIEPPSASARYIILVYRLKLRARERLSVFKRAQQSKVCTRTVHPTIRHFSIATFFLAPFRFVSFVSRARFCSHQLNAKKTDKKAFAPHRRW